MLGLVDSCSQDHASFTLVLETHCQLPFYEELKESPSRQQGPCCPLDYPKNRGFFTRGFGRSVLGVLQHFRGKGQCWKLEGI